MALPESDTVARPAGALRPVAVAGLLVGAWALIPPYLGPALATEARVEFADHVVPGIVVLAIAAASLVANTRRVSSLLLLLAGLGIVLAGFWMTATHVPLVLQAVDDKAPWGAALYHTAPGLAVLAVGGYWSARFWADQPDDEPPPG